uniref:Uncharacterized protein n=1 Tax=Haptolina brevifila TaxID=156173 RepID=A0A7S2GGE0_9EUKA|mmetsp:Transcript_35350/g.70474  ORF Transcript_35350/g.70474 Transcript_35350/m.70474 type:complete len:102 (+) Transcript_35350:170-475(+)
MVCTQHKYTQRARLENDVNAGTHPESDETSSGMKAPLVFLPLQRPASIERACSMTEYSTCDSAFKDEVECALPLIDDCDETRPTHCPNAAARVLCPKIVQT